MRIEKIYLKGYKRFRFNNINEFTASFPSPVTVVIGSNGSGKAQPLTDPIKIPGGWKMMGDIKVGDYVTAVDGTAARVSGVFPQGNKSLFRVRFCDNRFLDVPKDHLWTVYDLAHPEGVITTTEKLFIAVTRGQQAYIDTAVPEDVPPAKLCMHPYLFGVLMGKCNFTKYPYTVTVKHEVAKYIAQVLPEGTTIRMIHNNHEDSTTCEFVCDRRYENCLDNVLHRYGYANKRDWDKSVFRDLLDEASATQREQFLQGINDTCAFVNKIGQFEDRGGMTHFSFVTLSPRLADNIQQIVFSLGGVCSVVVKHPFRLVGKKYVQGITAYTLSYRLPDPDKAVNVKSKKANLQNHLKGYMACRLKIASVSALPVKARCQCIMIDHPRHLYVTKDYIVTHNTSLLNELCPLPAVRTDFEKDGMKVLEITHEGSSFVLTSDFSNKNSPHSFKKDDRELNIGHTTDIQTELVEKYFGITPSIRDLIYNKVKLTKTTKSERKNLFLKINPMDLSLIIDTHKKVLSRIKDCKANLTLLQTRKVDLESKMISPELLAQHKKTKKNLEDQVKLLQKITYALWQHSEGLLNNFKEDVEYAKTHKDIPLDEIMINCKRIRNDLIKYSKVTRGPMFYADKERIHGRYQELQEQKKNISEMIRNLSNEIDEFQSHLEKATDRPISSVEQEISQLDEEIAKFPKLMENVIPEDFIETHKAIIPEIKSIVELFMNTGVRMEPPEKINNKLYKYQELKQKAEFYSNQVNSLTIAIEEMEKEVKANNENASVPSGCKFTCGLKAVFLDRNMRIQEKLTEDCLELDCAKARLKECTDSYVKLENDMRAFQEHGLLRQFDRLKKLLCSGYFTLYSTDEDLVDKLNNAPMKIVSDLDTCIRDSLLRVELSKLVDKRKSLNTELETMLKTSGASQEFLQKELAKKEAIVKNKLKQLESVELESHEVDKEYNLYLEYTLACDKIQHYKDIYTKGERALLVKNAYKYWKALQNEYEEIHRRIQEDLRNLDSLVKEQEMIRNTYETEILKNIQIISDQKNVLDRLETALSPNSGIPHRSMVKYLNVMINNVNYFLSNIWSYRMKIDAVSEDEVIDYGFPICIGNENNKDISCTSDGQAEVIDLVWVLTILLQMKLLDKIPFFADEISRCMDDYHRGRTLEFLNSMIDNGLVEQLFIINHFAAISNGFKDCNVICLNSDNITDLPANTNNNVTIVNY